MTSDADLVELRTTTTAMEAEWFVGALKGFGIAAVTFGDQLTDEYAMSQKLMGFSGGVRVMVPRVQLEAARQALVEIKRDRPSPEEFEAAMAEVGGDTSDDETVDGDEKSSGVSTNTALLVILGLAVVALGWLSVSQHQELAAHERKRQRASAPSQTGRKERRWSDNGKLASIVFDRDRTGTSEELWIYDRTGVLFAKWYDENENRFWEAKAVTAEDGSELYRHVDANENGIAELKVYAAMDGVVRRWIDADEDGRYERYEFVQSEDGAVLDAFEDRGREGYVRVE